ncbi:MAG: BON domain-containing protein [Magnetococcales bacterium]|nr:BON domain-containing protein [Magnetococcales bacterium]
MKRIWIAGLLMGGALLSSCTPMVAGSGAVATGMVAERRGAGDYVEDNWAAWKIRSKYIRSDLVKVGNINVSVYQGRVLLTGAAASEEEIAEAIDLAKRTRGITEVSSEIKVQSETAKEIANDVWISTHVKAKLFSSDEVRGIDIHVETTKGVVYLTGQAQTLDERNKAIELAQRVKGVQEVVSYILVDGKAIPVSNEYSRQPE